MSLADTITSAASIAARVALQTFPDLCTVYSVTSTPDGFGGTSETLVSAIDDVQCFYEPLSQREQQIAGAQIPLYTHRVMMPATPETLAIKPSYRIVIAERGDTPELTFENPLPETGSFTPLMKVMATVRGI